MHGGHAIEGRPGRIDDRSKPLGVGRRARGGRSASVTRLGTPNAVPPAALGLLDQSRSASPASVGSASPASFATTAYRGAAASSASKRELARLARSRPARPVDRGRERFLRRGLDGRHDPTAHNRDDGDRRLITDSGYRRHRLGRRSHCDRWNRTGAWPIDVEFTRGVLRPSRSRTGDEEHRRQWRGGATARAGSSAAGLRDEAAIHADPDVGVVQSDEPVREDLPDPRDAGDRSSRCRRTRATTASPTSWWLYSMTGSTSGTPVLAGRCAIRDVVESGARGRGNAHPRALASREFRG